jgi:cell division protease FtsH
MLIIFFFIWGWLIRKMGKGPGFKNLGKSKAKIYEADASLKVTFEEVAGVDEAVEEVKEVVSFLKEPKSTPDWAPNCPRGSCWSVLPEPEKHCLRVPLPGKRMCRFLT